MKNLKALNILIVLIIEGFVSLSYQMLYMKQLSPWLGNNVVVSSWVIGTFLLALAIGYKHGGEYKNYVPNKISNNFIIASIISGIGLSFLFIDSFFSLFNHSYIIPLIIYCIIIIFPTAYILGQTVPLITKIMPKDEVGKVSGGVLFLSTIGSFLGAIITTNILLNYFGVSITLAINTVALILLSFLLNKTSKNIIFSSLTIIFILYLNIAFEKRTYVKTNAYSNYEVVEKNIGEEELIIFKSNKSFSSIIVKDLEENIGYIKEIQEVLFKKLNLKNKKILVIGAGGFLVSEYEKNNNKFTYLDIDPDIKRVAEDKFLLRNINGDFIEKDGRNYINYTNQKYDVVILDAFVSKKSIPEHLATKEFLKSTKEVISENGWFVMNSIQDTQFNEQYTRNMYKTIQNVFDFCYHYPLNLENELSNTIYICKKTNSTYQIYVDDLNNSNSDYFKLNK